jgi:hypothetical protein
MKMEDTRDYTVGECPICRQGQVFVVQAKEDASLLLICDDCESQWKSPAEYSNGNSLKSECDKVINAQWKAIVNAGWERFVTNPPRDT